MRLRYVGGALFLAWSFYVWRIYLPRNVANLREQLEPLTRIPSVLVWQSWWIDWFAALGLAFLALCVGGWLLSRARMEMRLAERLLLAPATGFLAMILASTALGAVGAFHAGVLRWMIALSALAALPRIPVEARFLRDCAALFWKKLRAEPEAGLYLLLGLPFLFFGFVESAVPETSFDALNAFLYFPKLFMQRGTFYATDLYRSMTPQYVEVLYAIGLALRGPSLARFLNFLLLPATGLAALLLAVRITSASRRMRAGALAILFLVSAPALLYHATICYADLAEMFAIIVALHALLRYLDTDRWPWLTLAASFAGLAAGIKYAGLGGIAVLAALLSVALLQRGWRISLRRACAFAAIALSIAAPWYVRNWHFTGDPLHPAFAHLLKRPAIDTVAAHEMVLDGLNKQRLPTTAKNLLKLPLLVTTQGDRLQGTIGPVFLWMLPLILIGMRRERNWMLIFAASISLALAFFFGPQWTRYFFPVLPLLACLGANSLSAPGRGWMRALALIPVLVNLPGMNPFWVGGGSNVLDQIRYDVAFGKTGRDRYQRSEVSGFAAVQYWNSLPLPQDTRIMPVPVSEFFSSALSRWEVVDLFENGQIVCKVSLFDCYGQPPRMLLANLDQHRVRMLAIRPNLDWLSPASDLRLEDPLLRTDFQLIRNEEGVFLYRRAPQGPHEGAAYVNASLLYRWLFGKGVAARTPDTISAVNYKPWGVQADRRAAMIFSSPAEVTWRIADAGAHPYFSLAMSAIDARNPELTVEVSNESFTQSTACYASPQAQLLGWQSCRLDLTDFADSAVTVKIRATHAAVADPVLFAVEQRARFTASPNPVIVTDGTGLGVTTLHWKAPTAAHVEVRVGSPCGSRLAYGGSTGSVTTGKWVSHGTVYLMDVTDNEKPTLLSTLELNTVSNAVPR